MTANGFIVIIPARYASTRLPGKPLADIAGWPMIRHVHARASESGAARVIIATDDERIEAVCRDFGAEVVRTRADHVSGTDRLAEVAEREGIADDTVVVNLQGDEPLMPPAMIAQVAEALARRPAAEIATLATPVGGREDVFDPNVVKVVRDRGGYALYFSRAPIPWHRDGFGREDAPLAAEYLRHLGIYAYRAAFLRAYPSLSEVELERVESLEQLRALFHGHRIYVDIAAQAPAPGVDTPADLEKVAAILRAKRGQPF